ncbi:hypothetical protein O5D80_005863 [Batrachochytrium dendrobatidis]|nr:hypothetical protein O5D80_005863 [Batrachochytrium dendrobatidis]
MGISGLLPLLKDIHRSVHLSNYSGQAVGVDAYVWLHKGAFACASELCQNIPTTKYITYCLNKVRQLQNHNIWPIIVFDGDRLPIKMRTENDRHKRREISRAKGFEYLRAGQRDKAQDCFQTCVDVTPRMAHELIKELRANNIEYIVAPYEADAQLTYLNKIGDISAIITEDSDLLVFGCSKVILKLDHQGNGIEIRQEDIANIKEMRFWSSDKFRHMCILSGCDYLESPQGIGIKKSIKLLAKCEAATLIKTWKAWGKAANSPKLPPNYYSRFMLADFAFQHQRVYDPQQGILVPLTPFPPDLELTEELSMIIGPDMSKKLAVGVAIGDYDPITKEPFSQRDELALPMHKPIPAQQYKKSENDVQKENNNPVIIHSLKSPSLLTCTSIPKPAHVAVSNQNPHTYTLPTSNFSQSQPNITQLKSDSIKPFTRNNSDSVSLATSHTNTLKRKSIVATSISATKPFTLENARLNGSKSMNCKSSVAAIHSTDFPRAKYTDQGFLDQNQRLKSRDSTTLVNSNDKQPHKDADDANHKPTTTTCMSSTKLSYARVLKSSHIGNTWSDRTNQIKPGQSTGLVSSYFASASIPSTPNTKTLHSEDGHAESVQRPVMANSRKSMFPKWDLAILSQNDKNKAEDAVKTMPLKSTLQPHSNAVEEETSSVGTSSQSTLSASCTRSDSKTSLESVFGYKHAGSAKRRLGTGRMLKSLAPPTTARMLR